MGSTSCISTPISSWKASAYHDPTKPALEHMLKFLEFVLKEEKELEVALSSTLVFMGYTMKKAATKPVNFGGSCLGNHPQPFYGYCLTKLPDVEEHADSMTAVALDGTVLFSFETADSVTKKMRRFVLDLDDKVYRRVGWAFFDLAYEIYNTTFCAAGSAITSNYPRLYAAKAVLDENRNRKFRR
ncbi:uncharacterized protein LOC119406726 [Rhipicephalus sanguineus]|nr:uncharacterized protein LOC119406726 [Rhipicephalus sanguineus]